MSNIPPPRLSPLSTVVTDNVIAQSDATALADRVFGDRYDDYDRLRPVFTNTGINKRHLAMPIDWYLEPRGWPDRTDTYIEQATQLFINASQDALEKAELKASDIDVIVSVSSTGIATPSLEARAAEKIGFRPDALRVPVFGMGCAGGVAGLALAARLASSEPGIRVLLVVVELCSMSFRLDKFTKANVVATALFGDGAAAAVVSTNTSEEQAALGFGRQHTWPKTLDIMGWKVDPTGFEVIFDRAIPPFARRHVRPVVDGFLADMAIDRAELDRFTFHPGGTKVLEALEAAFELQTGSLDAERAILADFGNMSAPTVLFVLQKTIESKLCGLSLVTALGPGFTAASIPVRTLQ